MNKWVRMGISMVAILIVVILIFWVVLPMLGVAAFFGGNYWIVSFIGCLVVSYVVSHLLNRYVFKGR